MTTLYLSDTVSTVDVGSGVAERDASLTQGATPATNTVSTMTGSNNWVYFNVDGGSTLVWYSPGLAAVTISGAVTFNLYGSESNMAANCQLGVDLFYCNSDGSGETTITTRSTPNVELGTAAGLQNWTFTPSSGVSLSDSQRLGVRVSIVNIGTMASGYTATLYYNGSGTSDSWFSTTETLSTSYGATVSAPVIATTTRLDTWKSSVSYPTSLDSLAAPASTTPMDDVGAAHDLHHAQLPHAIRVIEEELGINPHANRGTVAGAVEVMLKMTGEPAVRPSGTRYDTGNYHGAYAAGGSATASGPIYMVPFRATTDVYSGIGVTVGTGVAGSNILLGIYDIGSNGLPSSLKAQYGPVSGASAGAVISSATINLVRGQHYFLALQTSTGINIYILNSGMYRLARGATVGATYAGEEGIAYTGDTYDGTLPSTLGSLTLTSYGSAYRIFLRIN